MGNALPWHQPFTRALRLAAFLVSHTFVALLLMGAITIVRLGLARFGDPKLFDWVPIRYAFDVMETTVLIVFVLVGVAEAVSFCRDAMK